jgi:glycerol-3-phosphate dehydrogenase
VTTSRTSPSAGSLDSASRRRALDRLAADEPVDLVVVGGGATGAGVALDAATRGLRVVLLEARDLAFGTSRWSSKLIHGGLRYLASGALGLALESARERHVLLTRTAPHLVRPLPYVLPLNDQLDPRQGMAMRGGLALGDAMRTVARTPGAALPRSRRIGAVEARHLVPGLDPRRLRGAILGWDGQVEDDARLVVGIARTAAAHGADVLTGYAATHAEPGDVRAIDRDSGATIRLAPRAVINATGVWAGTLADDVALRPSRGSHLVFAPEAFGGAVRAQVSIPLAGRFGRFLLAIPRPDGTVILGLTDEALDGPIPDEPEPSEAEIAFLLEHGSEVFRRPLDRDQIKGSFAGLRPLVAGGEGAEGATADLSRSHLVHASTDGLVTVTGGKLTTYRQMAEDAVDRAVALHGIAAGPCRTRDTPLLGAAAPRSLAQVAAPRRLVERYGVEALRVRALADAHPELAAPVAPGSDVLGAELAWAVRHEGARSVSDVLDRRTRLGLQPALRSAAEPTAVRVLESFGGEDVR